MSRKKAPEGSDNNCSTLTQDTILFSRSPLKAKTQQDTQKAVMLSPFPIKLSKPLDIIVPRLSCSPRPTPRSVSSTHQGSPLLPLGPYPAPTNILVNENFTMGGNQISPSLSQKSVPEMPPALAVMALCSLPFSAKKSISDQWILCYLLILKQGLVCFYWWDKISKYS